MKILITLLLLSPMTVFAAADSIKLNAETIFSTVQDDKKTFPKAEFEDERKNFEAQSGIGCELLKKKTVLYCAKSYYDDSGKYKMLLPLDKGTEIKIDETETYLEITGPLAADLLKAGAKSEAKE